MELSGSSAVVTGGASGIGAAAARQLAARGAKVVDADLQEDAGNTVADQIGGAFCKVDVTNTDDIINAVEMATSMGPLKALVNSAGIGWAQRTVGKDGSYDSAANLEAFQRVININLIGTFDCIRLGATAMSRNEPDEFGERGAICNLASVAAFDGQIGQASYSASSTPSFISVPIAIGPGCPATSINESPVGNQANSRCEKSGSMSGENRFSAIMEGQYIGGVWAVSGSIKLVS